MFEELKDYIASHTKEEIQEDWKETPEFEPGIQNSDFEDLYTIPYTYELIDWLRNIHKIYISIFPVTWFQLSVNIYKIEENQVKEIFAQFCVTVNSDTDYNRFIDTILQHILMNIIYETETSKSSL